MFSNDVGCTICSKFSRVLINLSRVPHFVISRERERERDITLVVAVCSYAKVSKP